MQRLIPLCIAFCLGSFPALSIAEPDALALLERMGIAAKTLNYDGVFTYQTGGKVQSIRIIHSANEQGEVERLLSLNGAARELIRTNDLVTCIFPEGKRINIDRRPLGRGFPSDLLSRMSSAVPYYAIKMGEVGRVADRKAKQLVVTPIDAYRYGYHLWVDEETDLLLQSDLLTEKGQVIEKFTFSSINLNVDIPDLALKPQIEGQQHTWNRNQTEPVKKAKLASEEDKTTSLLWQVAWLPEGFALVAEQSRRKSHDQAVVEQRVYSDGLSSVSVFIEQKTAAHNHLQGGTKMGAINAFGIVADSHFITTVGQVPGQTVEKIGRSIKVPD